MKGIKELKEKWSPIFIEQVDEQSIHVVDNKDMGTIETFIQKLIQNHPQKKRISALIDAGALFKEFKNNEAVAKVLSRHLEKPVLFFKNGELHSIKPDQDTSDRIGGTSVDEIKAIGLNVGDYAIYLDEAHTTGVDIKLPNDAIGLLTVNGELTQRTYEQAEFRIRKILTAGQRLEYVFPNYLSGDATDNKESNKEIITTTNLLFVKNLSRKLSDDYYRACKERILNAFRQKCIEKLLASDFHSPSSFSNSIQNSAKIFEPFRKFIISYAHLIDAYLQFGPLSYEVPSFKELETYANTQMDKFKGSKEDLPKLEMK